MASPVRRQRRRGEAHPGRRQGQAGSSFRQTGSGASLRSLPPARGRRGALGCEQGLTMGVLSNARCSGKLVLVVIVSAVKWQSAGSTSPQQRLEGGAPEHGDERRADERGHPWRAQYLAPRHNRRRDIGVLGTHSLRRCQRAAREGRGSERQRHEQP